MDEIAKAGTLRGAELNMAKSVLAFEATLITHGEEAARAAWRAAVTTFGLKPVDRAFMPSSQIPREKEEADTSAIPSMVKKREVFEGGVAAFELFQEVKLCASRGEARRLIEQGGGYVNDYQIRFFDEKIGTEHVTDRGEILLRKGKKTYFRIIVE
jgi:tyrosyl-tRNA synthetase